MDGFVLKNWRGDFWMVARIVVTVGVLWLAGTMIGTNSDFLRGFLTGGGIAAAGAAVVVVVAHLVRGESLFRMAGERMTFLHSSSAAASFWIVGAGLVVFVFVAFSDLVEISASAGTIASSVLASMAIVYWIAFIVIARRH
ncbi:MAG: hypothetical protein ACOCY8_03435 [Spirochaetota bacterium]